MKPNTISIEADGFKIKGTAERFAQLVLASVVATAVAPAINVHPAPPSTIPALGEYWPGQGGFNGGLVAARGDVPAHYRIIAKDDVGEHEWGGRGTESAATSKTDGLANTVTLLKGEHPAAKAAAAYTADGHTDFYLPACAELYDCWVNVPELFAKDTWYWSSTQRSAYTAFTQHFDAGYPYNVVKSYELRVRPVRRLFI